VLQQQDALRAAFIQMLAAADGLVLRIGEPSTATAREGDSIGSSVQDRRLCAALAAVSAVMRSDLFADFRSAPVRVLTGERQPWPSDGDVSPGLR